MNEPTVTLYETNSALLAIAKDQKAWDLGIPNGNYLNGTFGTDAQAWIDGDWEPSEADGLRPLTDPDGLTPVAEWSTDGLRLLTDPDHIGYAAKTYLGQTYTLTIA